MTEKEKKEYEDLKREKKLAQLKKLKLMKTVETVVNHPSVKFFGFAAAACICSYISPGTGFYGSFFNSLVGASIGMSTLLGTASIGKSAVEYGLGKMIEKEKTLLLEEYKKEENKAESTIIYDEE